MADLEQLARNALPEVRFVAESVGLGALLRESCCEGLSTRLEGILFSG